MSAASTEFGDEMSPDAKDELISVLREAQTYLGRAKNSFDWSEWENAEQALRSVDSHIAAVERGDTSRLSDLALLFAPTGSIQEVSVSSDWGDEFLALAKRFDRALEKLRN